MIQGVQKADINAAKSLSSTGDKAAANLVLFSALLIVFGVGRTNLFDATPAAAMGGTSLEFPPAVLLASGVCLCFMGFAGLVNGMFHLSLHIRNVTMTLMSLALQGVLGWFVFFAQAIAFHAFQADKAHASPALSASLQKGLLMLGMFGSAALGIAALGGQFYFSLQLYRIHSQSEASLYRRDYIRPRIVFYCLLVVIKASCEIAMGAVVDEKKLLGGAEVQAPFMSFKYKLLIADGCIALAVGLYGMVIGLAGLSRQSLYFAVMAFVSLIFQLAMSDLAEEAYNPLRAPKASPPASKVFSLASLGVLLAPLTIALMYMPIYLIGELDKEETEQQDLPMTLQHPPNTQGIVFTHHP